MILIDYFNWIEWLFRRIFDWNKREEARGARWMDGGRTGSFVARKYIWIELFVGHLNGWHCQTAPISASDDLIAPDGPSSSSSSTRTTLSITQKASDAMIASQTHVLGLSRQFFYLKTEQFWTENQNSTFWPKKNKNIDQFLPKKWTILNWREKLNILT